MKRKMVLSFLCGLVLPLLASAIFGRMTTVREPEDVESDSLTATEPASGWDGEQRIMVLTDSGNVRQMRLNEYLAGVVLAEMPVDFEEEALKAQAVVARTYTCKRSEHSKHEGADVCTDSGCCQGYRDLQEYLDAGGTQEGVDKVRDAVASTDGTVLVYGGELIDATYFSCSGGTTEDAVAVWGQDVPYLQSVESPGEEDAPRYSDQVSYTPENFRLLTGCGGEGSPSAWFGGVTYTQGGGVDTIQICGETFTGTELRAALSLRSTKFSIDLVDGQIVVTTMGFGHRVGMSQYGAQAMAESGSDYQEILEHYYVGALLTQEVP